MSRPAIAETPQAAMEQFRGEAAITRFEAARIAKQWVADSAPPDMPLTAEVHEFDLGYVVWGRPPPGQPPLFGASRGIIDRETGELSVWPSLPVKMVIEQFRTKRAQRPPAPKTWHPAAHARRDLRRVATPANATHLFLIERKGSGAGRLLTARSVKGGPGA